MARATLMIGNSSAGIIEAPFYHLPVINIGDRQKGRVRTGRVLDSVFDAISISQLLLSTLHESSRRSLCETGDEATASPRILSAMSTLRSPRELREKN
jgi:UDP-N-acetylglucosamine 2-epimerase